MKNIIQKAVDGGFKWSGIDSDIVDVEISSVSFDWKGEALIIWGVNDDCTSIAFSDIIFSHEFLKAYFGEGEYKQVEAGEGSAWHFELRKGRAGYSKKYPAWRYHSQQLVLAEDRPEYLRRFLDENKNP